MRKGLHTYLLLLLILSNYVLGKDGNKTKLTKGHKKHNQLKDKSESERVKRSLPDDDEKFWANRGKRILDDDSKDILNYDKHLRSNDMEVKSHDLIEKYQPFWGSRGRRDSFENVIEVDPDNKVNEPRYRNNIFCKHCSAPSHNVDAVNLKNEIARREELVSPFWGNRGRRSSDEDDFDPEAFWGSRGRRQDDSPFWGNRGRRDAEPFWGNRGRRQDTPFWGNRGRREDEPFWGTRGRRDDSEPFWGNRGRRDDAEPFWGTRGRRKEPEPFWGSRGRRKEDLKDSILKTIDNVEDGIENLSRLRRSDITPNSFWMHRGRDSKMKLLFNGPSRSRVPFIAKQRGLVLGGQISDPGTVHDSRMVVDEPHYILVERASRSSGEEDPYYISRGKKYYLNYDMIKSDRDRRGAIEEIVKSVRNDPYYIARGKKDAKGNNIENATIANEEFMKVKDLICSAIDFVNIKNENENTKVKREANENDRDRRTTLKKLALQLQMDPYFVSRGKRTDPENNENIREFINDVATKCI